MKKRKLKKKNILVLLCLILIISIVLIFLFLKKDKYINKIEGTWTTDNVTVYQFNDDNTGTLILPLKNYKFVYKIDEKSLFIDFENEKSEDSEYTYTFEDDKLILEGKNGKFTFSKYEENKKSKK